MPSTATTSTSSIELTLNGNSEQITTPIPLVALDVPRAILLGRENATSLHTTGADEHSLEVPNGAEPSKMQQQLLLVWLHW